MWNLLRTRWAQGPRTSSFPKQIPELSPRFRGRLQLEPSRCDSECTACENICPTQAITRNPATKTKSPISLDLGACLFCGECAQACPTDAITSTANYRLATTTREALSLHGQELQLAERLSEDIAKHFGRSLGIRVVSAGGCAGCAAEVNALSNIIFDLGRFGIHVVASPRHADALLVTGAISRNMKSAVEATYQAIPSPKFVIAVGACAISGGPFASSDQVHAGTESTLPVDLFIPGCPPHPYTLLDGLLRALGQSVP